MTPQYKAEFYYWHGERASVHNTTALTEYLNSFGESGWSLIQMHPVSVGFLLVFKKPA